MGYVFQREWLEVMRRMGGPSGLATLLAACAAMILGVLRLQYGLLDPMILLALSAVGLVFAANFAAGAFAGEREAARLINGEGMLTAREMILGKTLAAASFGLVCWAATMATGLATLQKFHPSLRLPWERLALVGLFTLAAAWANANFAAALSLQLNDERVARRMVRAPGIVFVILLVLAPKLLPGALGGLLLDQLRPSRFPFSLLALTLLVLPLGWFLFRRAEAALEERRHPISIVPEE